MYRRMWNYIEKKSWKKEVKQKMFLLYTTLVFSLLGFIVWICIGSNLFAGKIWLLCFMGYPGFFPGLLGGVLFLYNAADFT